MNRVLTAGLAVFGLLGAAVFATTARAQDEGGDDVIKKTNNTAVTGKIGAEDVKGVSVTISKATIVLNWKDIKKGGITYFGGTKVKQAEDAFNGGDVDGAITVLEELRKSSDLRALLRPHVLNLLGASYLRRGDYDKCIAAYEELFKTSPKTQFLAQGGGENLVNAYLNKNDAAGAAEALTRLQAAVGADPSIALLTGRVKEATGDFASATGSYKTVAEGAGDDAVKAGAELGIGRCLLGQKKLAEAEAKFKGLTMRIELSPPTLAGAWNGLGDLMKANGFAKRDPDALTDALYAYLRGCVLYLPQPGDSTSEYEHSLRGAHDCFKMLSELETKPESKKVYASRARERLEVLQQKFPNSPYLRDTK